VCKKHRLNGTNVNLLSKFTLSFVLSPVALVNMLHALSAV